MSRLKEGWLVWDASTVLFVLRRLGGEDIIAPDYLLAIIS